MLLSDYCIEINTRGIKKAKKLSDTNYWRNRGGPAFTPDAQDAFYEDYAEDLRTSRRQN